MNLLKFDVSDGYRDPKDRGPRRLSERLQADLAWDYFFQHALGEDLSPKQVAAKFGVSGSATLNALRVMGTYRGPWRPQIRGEIAMKNSRDAAVLKMLQEGVVPAKIAKRMHVQRQTIDSVINRLDRKGQWRKPPTRSDQVSLEVRYQILTLHEEGIYWPNKIAHELGVPETTTRNIIKRAYRQGLVSNRVPTRVEAHVMRQSWLRSLRETEKVFEEAARLYHDEELTFKEVAERTGTSPNNARDRVMQSTRPHIRTREEQLQVARRRGTRKKPDASHLKRYWFVPGPKGTRASDVGRDSESDLQGAA